MALRMGCWWRAKGCSGQHKPPVNRGHPERPPREICLPLPLTGGGAKTRAGAPCPALGCGGGGKGGLSEATCRTTPMAVRLAVDLTSARGPNFRRLRAAVPVLPMAYSAVP